MSDPTNPKPPDRPLQAAAEQLVVIDRLVDTFCTELTQCLEKYILMKIFQGVEVQYVRAALQLIYHAWEARTDRRLEEYFLLNPEAFKELAQEHGAEGAEVFRSVQERAWDKLKAALPERKDRKVH